MYLMEDDIDEKPDPNDLLDTQRCSLSDLIVYDGYAYQTNYTTETTRYLVCTSEQLGCEASAHIPLDGESNTLTLKKQHNHGPDPNFIQRTGFIQELKKRVVQQAGTIKSIYDQACIDFPNVSALVAFQTIESTLRRARATTHPKEPFSLLEYGELITQSEWRRFSQTVNGRPFYSTTVEGSDGGVAVIFSNPDFIEKVSISTELHIDSSFILDSPIGDGNYLFSAHVILHGHSHAVLYALMSARSRSMYMAILSHLRQTAPGLVPTQIFCDFERTQYMSIQDSFPNAKIQGTYFHYTLHVYQKLLSMGLIDAAEDNNEFQNIIRMILSLALLPVDKIPLGINTIEKLVKPSLNEETFKELMRYLDEQWWRGVTPSLFTMYNEPQRTNNNIDMFHKTLRQRIQGVSNAWIFTEKLKEVECLTFRDCELLQGGHAISRERKTKLLTQDDKLTRAWRMIESKRLPAYSFLQRAADIIKNIETQLALSKDYYEAIDLIRGEEVLGKKIKLQDRRMMTSNYDEEMKKFRNTLKRKQTTVSNPSTKITNFKIPKKNITSNICIVCEDEDWEARCKLKPCAHSPLCTVCATRLVSDKMKCPVCKVVLQGFIEMD